MIVSLAFNDFKSKYAGSYFGVLWAFVQPLSTIIVFWFVFQVGLRVTPVDKDVPYALWFMAGLVPWFFFSESLLSATNCFIEYNYLVKKLVFKISILPVVKILSVLFVHVVFIVFLLAVYMMYGFRLDMYELQIPYFSVCMLVLTVSMSITTSSIVVFFKDFGHIIGIVMQFGMWLTPIMWSPKLIPDAYRWIFEANPMYYVVSGYRNSLITHQWFFNDQLGQTYYFWGFTLVMFVVGTLVFKRLKPHFADVL